MNDQTPRRFKGSLVERAAEYWHYPEVPAEPRRVAPQPRMPVYDELPPAPKSAPALRRGAEAEPLPPEPRIEPSHRRSAPIDRKSLSEGGMLVPGAPVGALAEEFRLVKRQLLITSRAVADRSPDKARMILVSSAKPDEGKTYCAINLALSMAAEKDVEILLVDADFAKPDVLDRLGLAGGPGLLDALSGAVANVEDCIIDTDVPQLSVLPAGTKSSSDTEWLTSERARRMLEGLAAANPRRIVIFDSPPALAASPASVLASLVGQVMLVVRADRTTEGDLRQSVALLDGCEHIQLLLNSVSFQPGGRRFGSYYGESGK